MSAPNKNGRGEPLNAAVEHVNDGQLQVAGELGFANALAIKNQGERLISEAGKVIDVDFSRVNRSGSVTLTLLCSWLRHAEALEKEITFSHLPADLLGVAKVSGVDQILPIK